MRFSALLLWIILPLALWGTWATRGTPHLVWEYSFRDNGNPHDPLAHRHYLTCTYVGWTGAVTVPAAAGQCPWVRFFKSGPGQ